MKKKGLIISTVVMVVVLIASLTTATYAWFTATGSATVNTIGFEVTTKSDLRIGVKVDNTFKKAADGSVGETDFLSDGAKYNPTSGHWEEGASGLGLSIDTGLDLSNITQAIYSFESVTKEGDVIKSATQTEYEKGEGQAVVAGKGLKLTGTEILKATGNGANITGSYAVAVKNTDYLDVVFGVAAAKSDVLSFGCLVTVKDTANLSAVGMNAAIHVAYSLDGTNYTEVDIYGSTKGGDRVADMTAPTTPSQEITDAGDSSKVNVPYIDMSADENANKFEQGDATLWIPIYASANSGQYASVGEDGIKQLHLIIYTCGPDSDCQTGRIGKATISIEFLAVNGSMYTEAKGGTPAPTPTV